MIGRILGSYRIIESIGQGGMGAVYLAEHPIMGSRAAIKVLLPEYSKNEGLIRRFFNEARAAAHLEHPAFVKVFDCGLIDDGAFIVMEFIKGEGLGERLFRVGRFPIAQAVALVRQIAEAMAVAHAAGIVHRDLKPDNLMVVAGKDGADGIKILDFGIAKLTGTTESTGPRTRTGTLLGTPQYMSPEQCRGTGDIDHRSDIYSLGCILHALIAGQPPFPLSGDGEIIAAHIYQPPQPLSELMPGVPAGVERAVLRALSKAQTERQPSMREFSDELAAALGTPVGRSPLEARPTERTVAVPPPARRRVDADATTVDRAAHERVSSGPVKVAKPVRRGRPRDVMFVVAGAVVLVAGTGGAYLWKTKPAPKATSVALERADIVAPKAGVSTAVAAVAPAVPAATPDAAPEAPAAAEPQPAEAADSVRVRVTSDPAGARVIDAATRKMLGTTPFDDRFPRSAKPMFLRLEKAGHVPKKLRVPLQDDGALDVRLDVQVEEVSDDSRKL